MKQIQSWTLVFVVFAMMVAGCQTESPPMSAAPSSDEFTPVVAALGNLDEQDRRVAESQKFCAVMETSLLGAMGTPLKLEINGEPVFICCAGCKSKAMKNPEETLARVAKLKADNGAAATK